MALRVTQNLQIALDVFSQIDAEATALSEKVSEARAATMAAEKEHDAIQRTWSKAYEVLRNAIREAANAG